jgi:hypothetical protein
MNTLTKKTSPVFIALSIAAPIAAALLHYGTRHWDESIVLSCVFVEACLWMALLGWSIWSIRQHRIRAVGGSLVCAYCLWLVLQVMSKW